VFNLCQVGKAQNPFVSFYGPEQYAAGEKNYDVAQDEDGFIYVANSEGVLIYDGKKWDLIEVNGNAAREVLYSKIYGLVVGTVNDVGLIKKDKFNRFYYESLSNFFQESVKPIQTVFSLHEANSNVFIETQQSIFVFDGKKIVAHPFDSYITHSYVVNGTFYVFDEELIYCYENNQFRPIRSHTFENGERLFLLFSDGLGKIVSGLESGRFITFDDSLGGTYKSWNSEADKFMKNADLYLAFYANKDYRYFIFPGYTNQVYVLDQVGNPVLKLNSSNGVLGTTFNNAFVDRENNIWISSNMGVSKVNLEIPFEKYDERNGLNIPINSIGYVDKTLYVGTDTGLLFSEDLGKTYKKLGFNTNQIWMIKPYRKGVLISAGNNGIAYIEKNKIIHQYETPTALMSFYISDIDDSIIYAGQYSGFSIFKFTDSGFSLIRDVEEIKSDVRTILEDSEQRIWLGTRFSGLYMIPFSTTFNHKPYHYGTEAGFSSLEHNMVYGNARKPYFTSKHHIYTYSETDNHFYLLQGDIGSKIKKNYPKLADDEYGNLWSLNDNIIINKKNPLVSDSTSLLFFKQKLIDVIGLGNDEYFIASNKAIFKIKLPISISTNAEDLLVRYVKKVGSEQFYEIKKNENGQNKVDVSDLSESIEMQLTYPSFIQEEQIRFRYRLYPKGSDVKTQWSDWQKNPKLILNSIFYGEFIFEAEAINGIGKFSKAVELIINRPRPIAYQPIAFIAYLFVLILFIYGIVYLRNRQILKKNIYLENLVQIRTDEVIKQNAELKDLADEMARANQFKSNMLKMAVHDLRNPLSVLSGYCELLTDDLSNDQKATVILSMDKLLDKLLLSVDSLLTADQKGPTDFHQKKVTIDLRSIVMDVISENTVLANKKKQTLNSDLDANCKILGDRFQILEVIDNLINNSIKYSPIGSEISVSLFRKPGVSLNKIVFKVSDNGVGVKPEDQQRIFSEYGQTENKPTGGEKSSGLGLSIVKEIVHWHNGRVWVESNPTEKPGATFIVEFPAI